MPPAPSSAGGCAGFWEICFRKCFIRCFLWSPPCLGLGGSGCDRLSPPHSSPGGILRRHQVRLQRREVRGGRRRGPRHPHRHRQSPGEDAEGRALRPLPRATVRSVPAGMQSTSKLPVSEVIPTLVEDGDPKNGTLQESLGLAGPQGQPSTSGV